MSTTAPVVTVPAPQTVAEAIAALHASNERMAQAADMLLKLAQLRDECPEMRTLTINPGNNGQYIVRDAAAWAAKSIGILNPGNVPVFIGIAGSSARPGSGAPSCPGSSSLILPVEVTGDIELGCDPAVLLANSTTIYLFRYVTVQPLVLRQVP